ncbi:MAG: hypothetical protein CM15mP127_04040 [Gammaproteobacteria bacterium]|nr:MAG: hypothetical protein CM15mP127_04040 [Gammaproteobacteria bacterium]
MMLLGGTAGSGSDYTFSSGTLTIINGATTGTITITDIINDLLDEIDETIIITLSNPVNATLDLMLYIHLSSVMMTVPQL